LAKKWNKRLTHTSKNDSNTTVINNQDSK